MPFDDGQDTGAPRPGPATETVVPGRPSPRGGPGRAVGLPSVSRTDGRSATRPSQRFVDRGRRRALTGGTVQAEQAGHERQGLSFGSGPASPA
ncbi:hypothetical protein DKG34_40860 [Streptomyces sp. NWU49]|nr:hypothetical protein DKG34_40860 [Streptomyces sp. NWU49]